MLKDASDLLREDSAPMNRTANGDGNGALHRHSSNAVLGGERKRAPHKFRRVAVIGLGYVGVPTAAMLALSGVPVLGIDVSEQVIDALRHLRLVGFEPDVATLLKAATESGNLELSSTSESCDAYVVAVPTPVFKDHRADLTYVLAAVRSLLPVIRADQLLIIESTIPPGTMAQLVAPLLASVPDGDRILLAHCPERVLQGATLKEMVGNDRIVGGSTPEAAERARDLYSSFVKGSIHVTDITTAEFVKVMENTYRDVNIALANEFAKLAEVIGVNAWEAIRLANNHPRVNVLRPGPGVGGHCVAVDPWFLVQIDSKRSHLIRTARMVNDEMPDHVCARLVRELGGRRGPIALLGIAYRSNLSDTRESPALRIRELLVAAGFSVRVHDPYVLSCPGIENLSFFDAIDSADSIVIATDHSAFSEVDPNEVACRVNNRLLLDTRACVDVNRWREAGFRVATLGVP